MKTKPSLMANLAWVWVLALSCVLPALAQDKDKACLECHAAVAQKQVVHAALEKGCVYCHAEIESNAQPHKIKGKTAKERSAEGSAMCDECHEKKLFEGKVVHGPIAVGNCQGCHTPHASEFRGLLKMEPVALCLDCHPDTLKAPHVIAGFTRSGHPLGNEKKEAKDPLRAGQKFYCVSCHEPHRSELPKLTRFAKGMVSCQKCHKM